MNWSNLNTVVSNFIHVFDDIIIALVFIKITFALPLKPSVNQIWSLSCYPAAFKLHEEFVSHCYSIMKIRKWDILLYVHLKVKLVIFDILLLRLPLEQFTDCRVHLNCRN